MAQSTRYHVVIQTSPTAWYQTYQGWDRVYATRREAVQARDRARGRFLSAQIRRVAVECSLPEEA